MNQQPPPSQTARLGFVDLIRGVFILLMIEGHTLRALLDPALQQTTAFRIHEMPHNLTGPAFLFASGAAYVYSTRARWDAFRRWSAPLQRRLLRWLVALLVGYGTQLTFATLRRSLTEMTPEQVAFLLSVSILQCIAFSLILLQGFVVVLPERWFLGATLISAACIALATPFAWEAGSDVPLWLASLISGSTRSAFPLFPYAGFALAGAAFGYLHALAREQGREPGFIHSSARVCIWLVLGSATLALLPLPEIYSDFWYTSPLFFSLRVGVLGLVIMGARLLEPRINSGWRWSGWRWSGWRWLGWRWLVIVGRESLLVYVVHLLVLYGSAFNADTNIQKVLGRNHPLGDALAIWLVFTAMMVLLALWWNWWKRGREWQAKVLASVVGGYYLYRFLLG